MPFALTLYGHRFYHLFIILGVVTLRSYIKLNICMYYVLVHGDWVPFTVQNTPRAVFDFVQIASTPLFSVHSVHLQRLFGCSRLLIHSRMLSNFVSYIHIYGQFKYLPTPWERFRLNISLSSVSKNSNAQRTKWKTFQFFSILFSQFILVMIKKYNSIKSVSSFFFSFWLHSVDSTQLMTKKHKSKFFFLFSRKQNAKQFFFCQVCTRITFTNHKELKLLRTNWSRWMWKQFIFPCVFQLGF